MAAKYCEHYPDCTQIVYDEGETKCRACRHYGKAELSETQRGLLALVREGMVFVSTRTKDNRRLFVAPQWATPEDREFTKVWLEHPHFGLDS